MDSNMRRSIILDNYQDAKNRGIPNEIDGYIKINSNNDSCIDNIDIYVKLDGNIIQDVKFEGEACVIAISSSSILSDLFIGKRISDVREDMIYLGFTSCNIEIDRAKMLLFNPKLAKTYTVSYRPQQQIDSFRSEDKPDILLYGGLLQMEKFSYRNVECISVPSVCATTKEMSDKRYSNTIGAWYVTVKTNKYGYLMSVKAIDSVYYKTNKDDYIKPKVLKLTNINN